jgi:3D (Asp-Asp-Asp) domain-containing protein
LYINSVIDYRIFGRRKEGGLKMKKAIMILTITCILALSVGSTVNATQASPFDEPMKLRCTCYLDSGITASGKPVRENIMAAKPEWIGCVACVNAVNPDGSIGEFIGLYEITDTGYGRETGQGVSSILKGKTLGTIEAGQTVDIWFPTSHQAEEWTDLYGDYVYIKLVRGVG